MAEPAAERDSKLDLAEKIFLLRSEAPGVDKAALQKEVLDAVAKDDLLPIYDHCCATLGWTVDQAKRDAMTTKNDEKMAELESKIKDAEENLGEQEVRDGLLAKADYLCSLGDKDAAIAAYAAAEGKSAGAGAKMDLAFSQIRLLMFYEDWREVRKFIAKAKVLCDSGGDWERKNKLKVYEAVFATYTRDFKMASTLFLEALATFTASELFPYSRVIFYAVVTSVVAMDRVSLKKSVVDASEVLTAIGQNPHLESFINSLHNCKYADFFKAFVEVVDQMRADPYLSPHIKYYMREVRVVAYAQFLESYKSVTIDSMASAFDVSATFLDTEVSDFIVAGRLNAKIDKVSGIIETNRPDQKNALYQDTIKKGDLLLNRVQKLSKIIDVKDAADAANYRPLTMLGSDYRILAKVLATRWTPLLAAVVGPEQTAFLAGRRISDNICLTQVLPGLLAANSADGVGPTGVALAPLNFRKAYATIDRGFLLAVMEAVGIGGGVLAWTRTILTRTYASAEVNGFISAPR
ncbi:hypothetical protein FOA52_009160 [Chlamydomonas sp. UWO 241]|nr:hypothetical protein FOA52_009160 [Chlamydomonas sp. UWO 241]